MLTMVDEYTRQCLVIQPEHSLTSHQVLATVQQLAQVRGAPAYIRSDHGSEFIASIIQDWCHRTGVQTVYVDPGSTWFIFSFGSIPRRLRRRLPSSSC